MMELIKFKLFNILLIVNILFTALNSINSLLNNVKAPKKLTNCKAQLDDGKIIDLSSLDNNQQPRKASDDKQGYDYFWNPCSPIQCRSGTLPTAAACQKSQTRPASSNLIGDQDSSTFSYDGGVLKITYSSSPRTTYLTCKCSKTESFAFNGEDPTNFYNFVLNSQACCPGGKTSGGGLSLGSVLLIIFFSCLFAYFIGGVLFMKFVKNSNGSDLVPNLTLWTSTAGLVKDGFVFVKNKATSGKNNYSSI